MKNRMILYAGVALIVALYVYDRNIKTETVIPAIVVSVTSQFAENGPDMWLITVTSDEGEVTLEPRPSRPNVAVDDRICVTEVMRQGQPSEYRLASGQNC